MNIRELLTDAAKRLQPRRITCAADNDLGRLEAEVLLAFALKKDRAWLLAHDADMIRTADSKRFQKLIARRLKREPVAYILGEKEFYGLPCSVNRHTLIPRPESEILVECARAALFTEPSTHDLVWDVGTGSGAIAIAIATHIAPRYVFATDISTAALSTAKKNAKRLRVKNVAFLKANLLDKSVRKFLATKKPTRLVVTANLPYLPAGDKKTMDRDVVGYEPSSALFAGRDGLTLIEKFLRQLAAFDIHFNTLLLEHDPRQTKKIRALAKKLFSVVTVKTYKDLAGHERVTEIHHSTR